MTKIIGIAGGSASGKTHLLQRLRKVFSERELAIVSQDDYYKSIEFQFTDEMGMVNYDLPEGIDAEELYKDLLKLSQGEPVKRKEYHFNNPNKEPSSKEIHPAPVIIIEGLFILHFERIKTLLDFRIFIDSSEEMMLDRRLKRDSTERGISEKNIHYQWQNHVLPAHEKYLYPYKEEVDLIVDSGVGVEKLREVIRGLNSHHQKHEGS